MLDRFLAWLRPAPTDPRTLFAQQMATLLREAPSVTSVTIEQEEFSLAITTDAGDSSRLYLGSFFVETREMSPDDRASRLAQIAEALRPAPVTTWEEARGMLVPLLRPSVYLLGTPLDEDTSRYPFAPFVDIWVATDNGGSFSVVSQSRVDGWGADEAAFIDAMNAREPELIDVPVTCEETPHGKLFCIAAEDGNDSGRLAFGGFLRSFQDKVEGRPLAIIPRPDLLWIAGDARSEMVASLVERARREYLAAPRPLSPVLYVEDESKKLAPYAWPHGGPLTVATKNLQVDLAEASYLTQTPALEAALEEAERDIFVATPFRIEGDDGVHRLVATWTKDVHSWLPAVDDLALVGWDPEDASALLLVPFEELSPRLSLLELSPPRFEALDGYPTREEIAELASRFARPAAKR